MIMPRGSDQLLLPVNPFFIALSLVLALGVNLLPVGRQPAMPDLLAVALVFWNVHQPRRVGVGFAFAFGLVMDVHQGAVLGQHALAYTLLSYLAITVHRRVLWFSLPAQALHVLPVFFAAHAVACCWRRCSRPCCGRWWCCCCWRRNGARPIRTRIDLSEGLAASMAELKNLERDLDRFNTRLLVAALFVLLCFGLLGWRMVVLQVVRHDELALQAEANRIAVLPVVPNRGLIVDRNGVVLANNYSAYTLEISPRRTAAPSKTRARPTKPPVPGRGRARAAVPQLPGGRGGQPPDRLHRPHQRRREEGDGRVGRRAAGQLPWHRGHRQARPGAAL